MSFYMKLMYRSNTYVCMCMYKIILHAKIPQATTCCLPKHPTIPPDKMVCCEQTKFSDFFFFISTKKSPSQLTIFFQFDHQKIWLSVYQYNTFVDAHDENVFSKYVSFHSNTMHIPNRINLHERDCSADIFVSITKGRRFYSCIALLKIVFNPK